MIRLNYICQKCGAMRRGQATPDRNPNPPPAPNCCGREMKELLSVQAVVANRMKKNQRVEWLMNGAPMERTITGRHGWRARKKRKT